MKFVVKLIAPDHYAGERLHALRHEALFFYALFLFLLQLSLRTIAIRFPGILGFASNITIGEIVDLTNRERAKNGLPELTVNDRLSQAAKEKGNYMFSKNYWAHIAPDGTTPWFFILRQNYRYLFAGENLAKDFQNSGDVVEAWMASRAGHRENVLNSSYKDIGVAVVNGVIDGFETTLVVQMFGTSAGSSAVTVASASSPTSKLPPPSSSPVTEEKPLPGKITPIPTSRPSPTARAENGKEETPSLTKARLTLPVVDIVALAKTVSFSFGFFLMGLFLLDGLISVRRNFVRISGHSLAHLSILLLLIASTWLFSPGTIR